MAKSFSEQIGAWASRTEKRIDAVYARSIELLAEEMSKTTKEGGKVPIDTGNLANSLLASKQSMPTTSDGPFTGSNVGIITATIRASHSVWLGYQAGYARRINNGFVGADSRGRVYNQQGAHFVESAVANWSNIVETAVNEIRFGR